MSLFGFLKDETKGAKKQKSVSSTAVNIDDCDLTVPIVINAGGFSDDGILQPTDGGLCMHVRTDY